MPEALKGKKSKRSKVTLKAGKALSYDRPVSSQLFEFIRDAIIRMELEPGQMISETALAEQFEVSRTPVREALINLANIGFVEVRPQRGTFVTKMSLDNILEARFIREALEVAVASFLAEQGSDEVIQACEQLIEDQKTAAKNNDTLLFQELDDQFHQALARSTGYHRVGKLVEAEKAHMDRLRNLSLQQSGQFKRVLVQHSAILEAIKSSSVELARKTMALHLREIYSVLEDIPEKYPEYFDSRSR